MGDARDALGGPRKSSLLKASTSLSEHSPWRYCLSRLKTPHSFKMSVFPKLIIMIPIKMPVGFFFFGVGVCVKNKLQDLSGNAESLKDYLRKKKKVDPDLHSIHRAQKLPQMGHRPHGESRNNTGVCLQELEVGQKC